MWRHSSGSHRLADAAAKIVGVRAPAAVRAVAGVAGCLSIVLAACGGLAHPVSNDGADAANPDANNPGSMILTISASRSNIAVGDTGSVTGTIGGRTLDNNGLFAVTSSDPSVLFVGGTSMFGRSVGSVTINATYSGYQASPPLTVTVHAAPNGSSAAVVALNTDPPSFSPAAVYVSSSATVQFTTGSTHNVVFDVLAGAPPDVPIGVGVALRAFGTPGAFTYRCTVHGEAGVVNVTP